MREALVVGNRRSLLALAALVCGLAFGALLAPSDAAAQFNPESYGENDYCAPEGPRGRGKGQDAVNNVTISVTGAPNAAASVAMYGTGADGCISPDPATPCTTTCTYEVMTVCEFHCFHDHTAPFHWTVALIPQENPPASYFQRWDAGCQPVKDAGRTNCVVRMSTDQTAVAVFGATEDTAAPTWPTPSPLSASPGSYNTTLSWTPANDAAGNLGGYEVFKGGVLLARVPRSMNTTSFQVDNLFCEDNYSFQVKAYDFSGNEVASNVVAVRTADCARPNTNPRPNTAIHVKPPKSTRSRTAFFHFGQRGTVKATKFQCKLDKGRWGSCSARTGKRYRSLKPGLHTFRVRAGNAAGFDATPATYTWRVRR
jgi:hypothetical protein